MRKRLLFLLLSFFTLQLSLSAQSLQPTVICTAGGYVLNGGVSLSSTVGQVAGATFVNGGIMLTQGEQQPYILLKILNLKAYLQGFYTGGGQMQAVLSGFDPFVPSNYCDTITVELRNSNSPFAVAASKKTVLLTNGTTSVQFPSSLGNNNYYIVVRHRNSLETWSKNPVSFSATTVTYDFSTP